MKAGHKTVRKIYVFINKLYEDTHTKKKSITSFHTACIHMIKYE